MPGYLLHEGITITCPHGGTGQLTVTATATVDGRRVATESDVTTVAGCVFNVSGAPSPCVQVRWKMPARQVKAGGVAVLLSDSIALCVAAGDVPQGPAQVSGFQTKVRGR